MPDFYVLRFVDGTEQTAPGMPEPATVGHAAAWAAERGYWDVATCLMELAHALADLELPAPAKTMLEREADALTELRLNREADELAARVMRCEHGYSAVDNVHVGTGGVCDLSAGTGV